ncbi:replication-associated recombination protein A [Candidatus Izimaplasma bacterium ZiA1]|uniref:replication-associated recombination protein A n=1 Tax=Candidatus Izimoplasma sp. ZiA1 TaxID=2024899 RepID=UPI00143A2E63
MEIKKPLAYIIRPKNLNEIVGQDHLVGKSGVITKMINNDQLFSMILYGPPGVGKTTIATILSDKFGINSFTFNASTDKKSDLKEIILKSKNYGCLLVIDEIHRMNKDVQDYLLPHVESGNVLMIGLTTNNPYHSVNRAIRSRCHVLKLKEIDSNDIFNLLKKVSKSKEDYLKCNYTDEVLKYISVNSGNDIRSSINSLEILAMAYENEDIDIEMAKKVLLKPSLALDKDEDNYYNILSAFQKSIRGSDVDASLHYLARLLVMEDLESILRRLTVIAYEDIGFGNPSIITKMDACYNAVVRIGMPEARIPLSLLVIDMALSPKSNTAEVSIDKAIKDINAGLTPKIPNHLINVANFEDKAKYIYPHDYEEALVYQQYLPDSLKNKVYFEGIPSGKYEKALLSQNVKIKKVIKK